VVTNLSVYLAAYVFVPFVFGENIPTAEFGMISTETACLLGHKKKTAKFFNEDFYLPLYLPLWVKQFMQV
jgi:hypothetical protein